MVGVLHKCRRFLFVVKSWGCPDFPHGRVVFFFCLQHDPHKLGTFFVSLCERVRVTLTVFFVVKMNLQFTPIFTQSHTSARFKQPIS